MSVSDRRSDREVQRTDRGADDAEEWSDVMPFGRADPIPRVKPPHPPPPAPVGRPKLWIGLGKQGRDRGGGVSRDDGHPKWHPDQTLSVSWPFPFTLSVCVHAC